MYVLCINGINVLMVVHMTNMGKIVIKILRSNTVTQTVLSGLTNL